MKLEKKTPSINNTKNKNEIVIHDYTKNTYSNTNVKTTQEKTEAIIVNSKHNFTNYKLPSLDLLEDHIKQEINNKKKK